jgi:hypothetical protein
LNPDQEIRIFEENKPSVQKSYVSRLTELIGWNGPNPIILGSETDTSFYNAKVTAENYRIVPEPITLLSSITAIGFGAAFKRKYSKQKIKSLEKQTA